MGPFPVLTLMPTVALSIWPHAYKQLWTTVHTVLSKVYCTNVRCTYVCVCLVLLVNLLRLQYLVTTSVIDNKFPCSMIALFSYTSTLCIVVPWDIVLQ